MSNIYTIYICHIYLLYIKHNLMGELAVTYTYTYIYTHILTIYNQLGNLDGHPRLPTARSTAGPTVDHPRC